MDRPKVFPPGSTIGILGGGQLGRMLALAAGQLGLNCHIFAPEADCPAFKVAAVHTVANYQDEAALVAFAAAVDVVTYEFENVPAETVRFLETRVPMRPGSRALETAQDRIAEKSLARSLGAMTAEFRAVHSVRDLHTAVADIGLPAVLKTTRLGYDGKGQAKIMSNADIEPAWVTMRRAASILERFVDFDCEVSVIAARGHDGSFAAYDVTQNVHRNHVLHTSTVPAHVSPEVQAEAVFVAQRILDSLDYVGVAGIEFFVAGDVIYVNEIAPRVHNSGHWTQDACTASQFEQHIRAVAGWPLASTTRHSDVIMTNLLGNDLQAWESLARESSAGLHLYGKTEVRPGRKMGHINRLFPRKT
jgi:5-(carboxyamino)imidazole ribonucleotide synthase